MQHLPDALLVEVSRTMTGTELDGQADVVANALNLVGRNDPADRAFDVVGDQFGAFDASPRRRTNVQLHQSGVNRGQEIFTDYEEQRKCADDEQRHRHGRERAVRDEGLECAAVAPSHA